MELYPTDRYISTAKKEMCYFFGCEFLRRAAAAIKLFSPGGYAGAPPRGRGG